MYISDKQKSTMKLIDDLLKEFGSDRWFTMPELPGVTAHTMPALVRKGFLEEHVGSLYGMSYYYRIKELKED